MQKTTKTTHPKTSLVISTPIGKTEGRNKEHTSKTSPIALMILYGKTSPVTNWEENLNNRPVSKNIRPQTKRKTGQQTQKKH